MMLLNKKIGVIVFAVAATVLVAACARRPAFDSDLDGIVHPYKFNMVGWELNALARDADRAVQGGWSAAETDTVISYFANLDQRKKLKPVLATVASGGGVDRDALSLKIDRLNEAVQSDAGSVESILQRQIRAVLSDQGIYNPYYGYTRLKIGFPPVNFKLGEPVHLLVISKREQIGNFRQVVLRQDLAVAEMERIEQEADRLGVSSLVVELGGFAGTYPTFVTNRADLRFTIEASVEEWTHQYLAFRPLGFRYVLSLLGIKPDPVIAAMNETVAGMFSEEIGQMVYERFYANHDIKRPAPPVRSGFNYSAEMRTIRKQVDSYLAAGLVDQAERFMEEKRQFLASKGYSIRKLNQAYFAFHGNYDARAPGSVSPLGGEFRTLRTRSQSIGDFLEKAASIGTRSQLQDLVR